MNMAYQLMLDRISADRSEQLEANNHETNFNAGGEAGETFLAWDTVSSSSAVAPGHSTVEWQGDEQPRPLVLSSFDTAFLSGENMQ